MNDSTGIMFPSDWELGTQSDLNMEDGSLSHYSNAQEPTNDFVFESWCATDQDPSLTGALEDDDEDMMVVDIMFSEGILDHPSTPPAGRLLIEEDLEATLAGEHDDDEDSFFSAKHDSYNISSSNSNSSNNNQISPTSVTSFLPVEQRYQASLDKLAESMKKSQETRKSLRVKTAENVQYSRWSDVSGTLSSIEKSTQQLQEYLKNKSTSLPTNNPPIL